MARTRKSGQKKTKEAEPKVEVQVEEDEFGPMRFRLRNGTFFEKGKKYSTGDIVASFRPLDEVFKNKFDKITDGPALTQAIPERRSKAFRTLNRNGGRFDVVNNKTGEIINDAHLTLEEAKELEYAAGAPFSEMPEHLLKMLHTHAHERLKETGTLDW